VKGGEGWLAREKGGRVPATPTQKTRRGDRGREKKTTGTQKKRKERRRKIIRLGGTAKTSSFGKAFVQRGTVFSKEKENSQTKKKGGGRRKREGGSSRGTTGTKQKRKKMNRGKEEKFGLSVKKNQGPPTGIRTNWSMGHQKKKKT